MTTDPYANMTDDEIAKQLEEAQKEDDEVVCVCEVTVVLRVRASSN